MSINPLTLNTSNQLSEADQDKLWKVLVAFVGALGEEFRLSYPNNYKDLCREVKKFGEIEDTRSQGKVIRGKISQSFLAFLTQNRLREKIDWMEFYKGKEKLLEHYDEGQQVSVFLSDEEAKRLDRILRENNIDPSLAFLASSSE